MAGRLFEPLEDFMKRFLISCALVLPLVAITAGPALAEVKTREKSQVKLEGLLGGVMKMFGGKAAKEGVVATAAVKGDRKATLNDSTGQIIDLSEEKVYDLDLKKKTYEVTTFEELRRRMREAREKAEKDAAQAQPKEEKTEKADRPQKEYEVDFDVKETGQKKQLAGYDAREVIMTITVREKGKTIDDGGFVMTADSWFGPQIAALKELHEFDARYWKQLQGTDALGMSAEQMATVAAMYPMVKQASERLSKESGKLQGTPLATTTTFDVVKSKEQMAQQTESSNSSGGGGFSGMLARKLAKKDGEVKSRATVFTVFSETQEISTTVAATDVAVPADFKEKK
jgi:hypothetical protein